MPIIKNPTRKKIKLNVVRIACQNIFSLISKYTCVFTNRLKGVSIILKMLPREHHFDLSITVCDNAKDNCPVFLNSSKSLHWSYPDPADITDFESRKIKLLEIYYDLGKRLNQLCTKY